MNNIKTVTTYIALTVAMMLLITVMMIQFLRVAFPKYPVMEAKIPIINNKLKNEQRQLNSYKLNIWRNTTKRTSGQSCAF
ncbi:hypothetical protein C2H92_02070 [Bacillus halotolerans]|nr:hypothetical protein C2H92_02070 [Bacillus halotolerans]